MQHTQKIKYSYATAVQNISRNCAESLSSLIEVLNQQLQIRLADSATLHHITIISFNTSELIHPRSNTKTYCADATNPKYVNLVLAQIPVADPESTVLSPSLPLCKTRHSASPHLAGTLVYDAKIRDRNSFEYADMC